MRDGLALWLPGWRDPCVLPDEQVLSGFAGWLQNRLGPPQTAAMLLHSYVSDGLAGLGAVVDSSELTEFCERNASAIEAMAWVEAES